MKIKQIFEKYPVASGRASAFLLLAIGAGGCGPTPEEIGRAVLLVSPLEMLVFLGLMRLLWVLWRKARPDLTMRLAPILWTTAALVLLAILAMVVPFSNPDSDHLEILNLLLLALCLGGSTALSAQLLMYLALRWLAPERAFHWSFLGAVAILSPAPLLAFVPGAEAFMDWAIPVWAAGGAWGIVPVVLFGIALLDAVLSRRRQVRGQTSQDSK